ncbi:MAG: ABC transporter permease [Thermoanaerobaculum sp.]|nr:ABC transporter permease [Thermoanaerobaculum sp.]MDW7966817.1 ABC transporter permease [Thermoanaerobaculum sp.]
MTGSRVAQIWQHRKLIWIMAKRAVKARYAGSLLGLAWAILEPLLQFGLYLVVFGVFLGLRGLAGGGAAFALWLLAGLVPFLLLQEGWVRAAGVFRAHAGLVKHVPVPLGVLLAAELVAVLARHAVMLALLVVVAAAGGYGSLSGLAPLAFGLVTSLLLLVGGGLFLAVAGTYLPDTAPVTATAMGLALYLTPILYPAQVVPEALRRWFWLNPLFGVVESFRGLLGSAPLGWAALASAGWGLLILAGGWSLFTRRENQLRDLV